MIDRVAAKYGVPREQMVAHHEQLARDAASVAARVRNAAGQFLGLANIVQGVLRVEKLFVERN